MNDDLSMMQTSSLHGVTLDGLPADRPAERSATLTGASLRRVTLGLILAVTAFMDFFQLGRLGYDNTYYAAGVKSMLESWHNFFFVSFDPGGFVTIDKPPLGFWLQAASAGIFGFHGWSLILPEALAGVGSVALMYALVRRSFGDLAGLLAAAVMAVTPVAVATNRSNIVDSLLVFTLLLGTWAVLRATELGKLRWLLLAMFLVGVGFNIKMLQAYLVVPAFIAVYFLGAPVRWRTRVWHLAVAGLVLVIVSLSWATAVDLTPASQRPYVGSSDNNSEYNLIFGYNGLNRLLSGSWSFLGLHGRGFGRGPVQAGPAPSSRNNGARFGFGQGENGVSGPLRLVNAELGGQAGWLLPLALMGIVAAGWQMRPRLPLEERQRSVLFWAVWLLAGAGFFSVAGFFHAYYLVMLGPPIAALGGIGLTTMWHDYRGTTWRGWLLPFALVIVALVQRHILGYYTTWHPWISTEITLLAAGSAAMLVLRRVVRLFANGRLGRRLQLVLTRGGVALLALGILAIGLAPSAWAMETTLHGAGGLLPTAGPNTRGFSGGARGGFQPNRPFDIPGFPNTIGPGGFGSSVDPLTLEFLLKNQGSATFLVATLNANSAAPIILATGKPVMALGGFTGSDPILSVADLQKLISDGTVRFFMIQGGFGPGRGFIAPASQGDRTGGPSDVGGGREPGQFQRGQLGEPRVNGQAPIGTPGQPITQPSVTSGRVSGENLTAWITSNCLPVSPASINGTGSAVGRSAGLYDCAP